MTRAPKSKKQSLNKSQPTADLPVLTRREAQVAVGIGEGKTYPQIATMLGLKYETVRSYVNKLRDKTGRRSKSLLVLWAANQRQWLDKCLSGDKRAAS